MTKIVCKENVAQQMTELLMQFVDIASMFPSEKPDAYVWERVLIFVPQQGTWVGLTEAQRKEIERQSVYIDGAIRMTEAKLKENNNE